MEFLSTQGNINWFEKPKVNFRRLCFALKAKNKQQAQKHLGCEEIGILVCLSVNSLITVVA